MVIFCCIAYLFILLSLEMLIQMMAICFALALMALLCWGRVLVKKMRKYMSLSLPETDVGGFIVQAPELHVHPSVSFLILLINTVCILWILLNMVLSWRKGRQLLRKVIEESALRQLVPGCQGVWTRTLHLNRQAILTN